MSLFPITATHPVRLIEGNLIVELALRGPQPPAKAKFGGTIEPTLFGSFAITAFVVGMSLIFMPKAQKESSDFTPTHLAAIRAALVPPPKKDKPKPKEKERVAEKPRPTPQPKEDVPDKAPPKQPTVASTNQAIKAVQKLVSAGPAVQSILAATAKIGSGPKGYGDKGMGYKLSPLTGKPPIQMAGVGFGAGLGGFGTQTKGMGALRGMGDGGAPGQFAIGGIGKGHAVGGIVVQAPSRGATVKGTMDREAVAKVINEHIAEVRGCYERALLREPGLAGKLVLEWTIGTPGTVSEVRTKSVTLRNTDVTNCIITSLKTWRFPKPTGGVVVVSYPFLFNSVGF